MSTYSSPDDRYDGAAAVEQKQTQATQGHERYHSAVFSSTSVLQKGSSSRRFADRYQHASRPQAIRCLPSRRPKLLAEIYLCIRNEREEQTRKAAGIRISTSNPPSGRLDARSWPPCSLTARSAIDKPQSGPTRLPVAGVVQPVKGLENLFKSLVRNSRAGVEHSNDQLLSRFASPAAPVGSRRRCLRQCSASHSGSRSQSRCATIPDRLPPGIRQSGSAAVTLQPRPGVSYSASRATCSTSSRSDSFVLRMPSVPDSSRAIVSSR